MLNVSESACALMSNLLNDAQAPEGVVVRMVPADNGLSLTMDQVQSEDATFDHDGRPVLAVGQEVVAAVDNTVLDVVSTPEGPQLTLTPAGEAT